MALKVSGIEGREARVAYLQRYIARGRWMARDDLKFARLWKCDATGVRQLAAEARRALKRESTPEEQEALALDLIARLDAVYIAAMAANNHMGAIAAIKERAKLGGLAKPAEVSLAVTEDAFDRFAKRATQ